ncbi:putative transposase OrfB [Limihaloglobus sulfuriphilus]|uniref:Putative transposase OrfB n=1 Tax=Limihaloglobus sulfuriphilus TaxID=1851148 RepID=A0A1Q2MFG5_9BACT|nr:IS3 family transposase [Limihaloglobus sulfuriphilus]AQQ71443.1 putative transposase OrfB [Limihaloglobus sulfuriphilus]
MNSNFEIVNYAGGLILKAVVIAAGFSGRIRKKSLKRLARMNVDEKDKEILFLRNKVEQLQMQNSILLKANSKEPQGKRYSLREKLYVIFYMENYQIARNKISKHLGVAKSTYYRWLKRIEEKSKNHVPANKTPDDVVSLVWEIARANTGWGRHRIANQLKLLGIFLAASTSRNILNRPEPKNRPKMSSKKKIDKPEARQIPAWYPNHVWSIDTTVVRKWGLFAVHVCVIIDHFSRKVVAAAPLEGPNAGWVINIMDEAIDKYGSPKHLISDQGSVFISEAFAECLRHYNIKHRLGAIGKHGSIAVTERVNRTLKSEWLNRVPIIRGIDHLQELCDKFQLWYNTWRPHMSLDGKRPDDVFFGNLPEAPARDAKTVPANIERRYFSQTRVTGYRLKSAG